MLKFRPLVNFEERFFEDFSLKQSGAAPSAPKTSSKIEGLRSSSLQGPLVRIKDPKVAAAYLAAIRREKAKELSGLEATMHEGAMRFDDFLRVVEESLARRGSPRTPTKTKGASKE